MASRRALGSVERRKRKDGTYKPGYYGKFTWQARRYVRSAGPTRAHARRKLDAAHGLLAAGVPIGQVLAEVFGDFDGTKLTFKDAVPLYLEYAEKRKRQSTFESDVRRFKVILRAAWTTQYLARVTPEQLTKWVSARLAEETGPATINRGLHLISAVYKWAIRMGFVSENPVRRVEKLKEATGREVYLTAQECRTLAQAAPEPFGAVLTCAYATGLRKGEIASLCWPSVDLEAATVTVEADKAKSARRRAVPLPAALLAVLRAQRAGRRVWRLDGSDSVFTQEDGSPWTDGAMRRAWDKAKAAAAVRVEEDLTKAPSAEEREEARATLARFGRVRFHDLRHSYASMLVAQGVPLFDVAKLLGHGSLAMTMRYSHFQPRNVKRATDALESALNSLGESHPEGHPEGGDGGKSVAANG